MTAKTFRFSPYLKTMARFLRDNRNMWHQADITKDLFQLKRNFPFLKEKTKVGTSKNVLVVSLTSFLYQIKLEALFAKALQLNGCAVQVVTWRHCFWAQAYFRLFGIDSFVYLDDYLREFSDKDVAEDCQKLLKQGLGFQQVKAWRVKGCRVGQQVLSTVARICHGTPDLNNPTARALFEKYLRYNLRSISAAERVLTEVSPDILLFNEAQGANYGCFFDLGHQQKRDLIQFVQPLRDDALIFKRFDDESYGLHPNSLSKSTFERIKNFSWAPEHEEELWQEFSQRYGGKWFLSQRNFENTIQKDRAAIVRQLGLAEDKKTAVVFSHVLWDANLFYGEDIFEDYEDWFLETVKAACRNSAVNWVIKLHPGNVWKRKRENIQGELREVTIIREQIGPLPEHVKLLFPETDINAFSLFKMADYGITSRGTIGMELPCFGVPVLTAGTGRYSGLGFTIDSSSQKEYLIKLGRIQSFPRLSPDATLLAKKHAFAVFSLRPCPFSSIKTQFKYQKKGTHPLDHNYALLLDSLESLRQARDLKMFTDWVLHSSEPDFLQDRSVLAGDEEIAAVSYVDQN